MSVPGVAPVGRTRALAGAVLLDLAVSPLFAWDVFTDSLRRDLGVSDALLAGVFSVGLVAFMAGVLLGGRAADAAPPRRLALVALAGTVLGLLGTGAAPSAGVLVVAFGVLVGGSTGLGYATAVRVAGTVAARRGLALGVVVSAYAVGTAALAPTASALLALLGRGGTFVVLAGALGGILLLAAVLVPGTRPTAAPRTTRSTRARPSGAVVALWAAFGLGSAPALAAFAQAGALAATPGAVALAVALLNVGNFAGRLVVGPLSDRLGRPAALHADAALLVAACVPFALGAAGPAALVALLVLGLQYGALSTLVPAATADVVPGERFGTTYGLVFTGWGLAGLVAPVGAAALAVGIGLDGAYRAFLVVAALAWGGVVAYGRSGGSTGRP
ncbi:MFS transporter [Actinomycetospora sp. TBRC 11914]|uniref:MFS transporter n=1 Tax=Actinomycetospora sp. TBRC 11914 TaxID=2729387 RepID=UPI00145C7C6A|nr:MFS transporter [Actinomycetospora sp. TBRC 11914]NMO90236.1 OFA family MFS transporter [Actinomycetospora sp. TBRC 11914]